MISAGVADDGIKHTGTSLENISIENKTSYLVNAIMELKKNKTNGYLRNFSFKNITTEYMFQLPNGTVTKQAIKGTNW